MINEIIQSPLSEQLIVVILAALPLAELRGSLPVAMEVFGLPWHLAFLLSVMGNILPIPFLLIFINSLSRLMCRNVHGKRFMEWLYQRTRRQSGIIEKYQHLGLIVFVAIPLPGTGAWTASIAAHLLGLKFWHSLLDITLGVIGAGVIVTGLVLLGWIGAGVVLLAIIFFLLFSLRGKVKKNAARM